jgi:D-alanyl-D-alanine carboxypeptidase
MPDMQYPHFLRENLQRYESYYETNPELQFSKVIAYVNANIDLGGYNGIQTVDDPESIAVLVNKNFELPLGYEPDLVDAGYGVRLREEALEQYTRMKEDMADLGLRIYVIAAYRPYRTQASKFNAALASSGRASAERQFARPGHSEHQTGLAVDVLQRTISREEAMSALRFENTDQYAWMRENAHNYGFILRYPREYRDVHGFIFEPWHWRYVGVDIATAMFDEGIVLFEEYYGMYLAPGIAARSENGQAARSWALGYE